MVVITIERKTNETELDYHKRLVYGKLVDKTLSDMDYTELAELVYGHPYSSDVARRMLYGSRRTLELMDAEQIAGIESSDMLSRLDTKIAEIYKQTQKCRDQRRELNKIMSAVARQEHLYDSLIEAAKSLNDSVGCLYDYSGHENCTTSDNEAVLVFSDWHFGLKTDNIFNEFNTEICKSRVKTVVDMAADRIRLHSCRKLHIVILGDLYHGAIHNSVRVASEELVCNQLMQATEILAQSIEYLSRFVDETEVYMTYGNHARTVQNKNDSIHRDNMERIIPWWLGQRFALYDNIIVNPDEGHEFIFVTACGHEICATHGDNDSVRSAPRLIATLMQKKCGRDIEYILLGDKHHRESFDELGVTAFLCGSLCGADDHANSKRLYSEPSQLLLITNPECGVDAEYRIKCS